MTVVISGGLLTSMMLNLLELPTLALRFGRFATAESLGEFAKPAPSGKGSLPSPAER